MSKEVSRKAYHRARYGGAWPTNRTLPLWETWNLVKPYDTCPDWANKGFRVWRFQVALLLLGPWRGIDCILNRHRWQISLGLGEWVFEVEWIWSTRLIDDFEELER